MRRNWRGATRHDASSARASIAGRLPATRRRMPRLGAICMAWLALYFIVATAIGGSAAQAADAKTDLPIVGSLPSLGSGTKLFVDEPGQHVIELLGGHEPAVAAIFDGDLHKIAE